MCALENTVRDLRMWLRTPWSYSLPNHVLPVVVRSSLHNVSDALEEIDEVVWVSGVDLFIMALG